MHKALIYLRVSTDKQAEKGLSIPAQKEKCLQYASVNKYEVDEGADIYEDKGESARTTNRPDFLRLWERCRNDKAIKAVIVYDISRFARDRIDFALVKSDLVKRGIKILSVSEGIDETPSGQLLEGVLSTVAEFFSLQGGEKIKIGMRRKANEGTYPTRAPYGYKNVREVISGDKNRAWIEVDEKEAIWVEKAFRLYATGDYSLRELTELLAEQGFPSRTGKKPYVSFMEKMLKNKIYIGWIVWGGIENPNGKHKPIISRELFDKAEAIREAHNLGGNRTRKHIFILRGIAKCGECGSRWQAGYHTNNRGKKYGLYDCQKAQKAQRVACSQKSAPLDDLEGQFAQIFKQVQLPASFVEKIRDRVRTIYAKEEETYNKLAVMYASDQTKIKEQTDRLIKLYMNNGINDERYEEEKKKLDLEEIRLKENSTKVEGELKNTIRVIETAISLANNCYRTYQKAPYELKVLMGHAFFKEIVILDKQIIRATLNPPLDYLCAKRLQRNSLFQLANVCGPTGN